MIKDASKTSDASADVLIGSAGGDAVSSIGGYERFEDGAGYDNLQVLGSGLSLSGGAGDDPFHLGSQATNSIIDGGSGFDFAAITTGSFSAADLDIDVSNLAGGTFHFAAGNVSVVNVEAFDIRTGYGDDRIVLSGNNDAASAGEGNDALFGLGGDDTLDGGRGIDAISGGAGNDRIIGFDGHDVLTGEDGADTFAFGRDALKSANADTITDFDAADGDLIDLTDYFQSSLSADGDPIGRPLNIEDAVEFIDTANGV
jgi:Ca2+-binding RTX toxin-like protein